MTFYDDLVNVAVRVMRGNVTTSNKCPVCSKREVVYVLGSMSHLTFSYYEHLHKYITFEKIMPSSKHHRKAGTETRKVAHGKCFKRVNI